MNKGLLIETHLFEAKLLQEENGTYLVKGILQRAGAPNQNGRRYPKEILERECEKYKQLIKERRALGELDHPDSPVINLKNVSHNIREIYWEGDDVYGVVEILSTPSGNILRELLKNNIPEREKLISESLNVFLNSFIIFSGIVGLVSINLSNSSLQKSMNFVTSFLSCGCLANSILMFL